MVVHWLQFKAASACWGLGLDGSDLWWECSDLGVQLRVELRLLKFFVLERPEPLWLWNIGWGGICDGRVGATVRPNSWSIWCQGSATIECVSVHKCPGEAGWRRVFLATRCHYGVLSCPSPWMDAAWEIPRWPLEKTYLGLELLNEFSKQTRESTLALGGREEKCDVRQLRFANAATVIGMPVSNVTGPDKFEFKIEHTRRATHMRQTRAAIKGVNAPKEPSDSKLMNAKMKDPVTTMDVG
ncbi:hypothetical protein B0H12DRAFT_1077828 [Mycena haematopus]|nr:hypothetical protein B0H12DRAFT_1077828 [Mycena haematopus]